MHVPKHFSENDPEFLNTLIRSASFASLIMTEGATPMATHLPLHLAPDDGQYGTLYGHVARANDHWKLFDGHATALAIFTGINAYIAPNWYASDNQVPTWNYAAVHAYGQPEIVDQPDAVLDILYHLNKGNENDATGVWTIDKMEPTVLHAMLKGIVAFALPITRIEGKVKMGQNKKPEDTAGAIKGLRSADNPMWRAVADEMERRS